jgi:signal transduction histidine kinase
MVLLTLFTFWITAKGVTTLVEDEYWNRMDRIVRLLAQRPYLRNPAIQAQLEDLVGGKIGFYDPQGHPQNQSPSSLVTPLSGSPWPVLPDEVMLALANSREPHLFVPQSSSGSNTILLSSLESPLHDTTVIGLMIPTGPLREFRRNIMLALATHAGLGLLLLLLLVMLFSKTIGRQLHSLISHMEKVADGSLHTRIPETGLPEWRRLAIAFNRMMEQLQNYQNKLRVGERLAAVGELSAVLAHEVRNPLTGLKMMSQLLKKRCGDTGQIVDLVDPMLLEIDRIDCLVQDISDWSRPRTPQMETTDLNSLIAEVLKLAKAIFAKKDIQLVWQPGSIIPVAVDHVQIKQVLWNLLKNAENVSTPGNKVTLQTSMTEKGEVRFAIRDQGPGIDEVDKSRIFDPFFSTSSQGLGLGLSISRRIVEDHGGRLEYTTDHSGVEFFMLLPSSLEKRSKSIAEE